LVVGSPGKVIRQLDEQSRVMLLASAASYVHEGKVMLNELVEVQR
jgi:carbonic anhydrase/acetyltransferase-like protein (isoleucine patch superfamily)